MATPLGIILSKNILILCTNIKHEDQNQSVSDDLMNPTIVPCNQG